MTEFFAPTACKVAHPDCFYIGGEWVKAAGPGSFDVINPATEQLVARVPDATAAQIDLAVKAAHRAFTQGPWPQTSPAERAELLRRLAAELRARRGELALAATIQMGAPIWLSEGGVDYPAALLEKNAQMIETMALEAVREREGGKSIVVREPVGVVAAIAPWNTPLMLSVVKVAHALAAGCTVILKPAPETPLEGLILAECCEKIGLPAGVFNLVQAGRESGEALVRHPLVDKVAFTGSTAAGKRIAGICAERVARVSLELGGKSAAVVLDDMNPEDVLPAFVPSAMFLSGQACACVTRLIVPRARKAEYEEALVHAIGQLPLGDPMDAGTFIGPVALERQRDRIEGYIARGKQEGAKLLIGGARPIQMERGFYLEPTLFSNATNDMAIAREEIFGPVLTLLTHDGEDDAIRIANDSEFGLNGAVYTHDADRAYGLMRRVRAGNMTHNGWVTDPDCPFGGFKQSGIGREQGPEGLAGYFEYKAIYMPALPSHLG
jgi:aldehyde dehydrogenase (NAD+)